MGIATSTMYYFNTLNMTQDLAVDNFVFFNLG